jgi:hypothetical protein
VQDDLCDLGNVAEGARLIQQAQHLALASRPSQRAVLVVGRGARPLAEPLLVLGRAVAGRVVLVCEGEEVRGDCALVRLLEARQAEGTGLEETR